MRAVGSFAWPIIDTLAPLMVACVRHLCRWRKGKSQDTPTTDSPTASPASTETSQQASSEQLPRRRFNFSFSKVSFKTNLTFTLPSRRSEDYRVRRPRSLFPSGLFSSSPSTPLASPTGSCGAHSFDAYYFDGPTAEIKEEEDSARENDKKPSEASEWWHVEPLAQAATKLLLPVHNARSKHAPLHQVS